MNAHNPPSPQPSLRDLAHDVQFFRTVLNDIGQGVTLTVQVGNNEAIQIDWNGSNPIYTRIADALKEQYEADLALAERAIVSNVLNKALAK